MYIKCDYCIKHLLENYSLLLKCILNQVLLILKFEFWAKWRIYSFYNYVFFVCKHIFLCKKCSDLYKLTHFPVDFTTDCTIRVLNINFLMQQFKAVVLRCKTIKQYRPSNMQSCFLSRPFLLYLFIEKCLLFETVQTEHHNLKGVCVKNL